MQTDLQCMICFIRQAIQAGQIASDDPAVHDRIVRQMHRMAAEVDRTLPPPALAEHFHRYVRQLVGCDDPYLPLKRKANELALGLLDELREKIAASDDPLAAATRLAMAGNIIDVGIGYTPSDEEIHQAIDQALHEPIDTAALERLGQALASAKSVFYIADNAGEIAFDRLLVEHIGPERITLAVRGGPILNDALIEDARQVGLADMVPVVQTGQALPGVLVESASQEFQEHFARADVVISKGQGNYETLDTQDRPIFFLLRVKCPVVSQALDLPLGRLALLARP